MIVKSTRKTFDGVGREESEIARLKRIVICEIRRPTLRFRLTRQRRVVHLQYTINNCVGPPTQRPKRGKRLVSMAVTLFYFITVLLVE